MLAAPLRGMTGWALVKAAGMLDAHLTPAAADVAAGVAVDAAAAAVDIGVVVVVAAVGVGAGYASAVAVATEERLAC